MKLNIERWKNIGGSLQSQKREKNISLHRKLKIKNDTFLCIEFRLHAESFPADVCVLFQLFVYTCAKKEYAEKILDVLDPQRKLFRYVSLPHVTFHLCSINSFLDRRDTRSDTVIRSNSSVITTSVAH